MTPAQRIQHGNEFPYDAKDKWWNKRNPEPAPLPIDWAHSAARGVIADLQDRGGIKHGFDDIDEDIRAEIVSELAEIIRTAANVKAAVAVTAERIKQRQTARCDYCRKVVQHEVNGIGMWLCPVCRRDMTPPPNVPLEPPRPTRLAASKKG